MNQARWVTTNSRCLRFYISKKKLDPMSTYKLRLIVEFIIKVYSNAWFSIRVDPRWTLGPKIYLGKASKNGKLNDISQKLGPGLGSGFCPNKICCQNCYILTKGWVGEEFKCPDFSLLFQPNFSFFFGHLHSDVIIKIQSQDEEVQKIVAKTIQNGAYFCHSEMILQHLLTDGNSGDRRFAYNTILKIREARGHPEIGDSSYRQRKNPPINMKATSFQDLIDWSKPDQLHEPVLTANIASKDLAQFLDHRMEVENLPVHTQVLFYDLRKN